MTSFVIIYLLFSFVDHKFGKKRKNFQLFPNV